MHKLSRKSDLWVWQLGEEVWRGVFGKYLHLSYVMVNYQLDWALDVQI
jgi:hypothetical protein